MTLSVESHASPTLSGPRRAGTVDRVPSGGWRVRFRTPDGKRRSKTFPTADEAELFRAGCERLYGDQPSLTLAGLAADWLDARELSGEHRNMRGERSLWKTHVEGTRLAEMPLKSITRRDVKAWLDEVKAKRAQAPRKGQKAPTLTTRPLSRSVVSQALIIVRQLLQSAVEEDILAANPARDVKINRRVASTSEGWTFLTVDEIRQVLASDATPFSVRTIHTVAIYTGLRQGELWGLKWEDVHLDGDRPELVVRFSHKGPTKSGKVRRVPLLAPAREALRAWKAVCPKHFEGLVFVSPRGERRHLSDDAGWADQCIAKSKRSKTGPTHTPGWKSRAGITRRVRFHDLRHTCASHLVMGSWGRAWSLSEVRDMLGHASVTITQKYAHLSAAHLANAAADTCAAPALGSRLGLAGSAASHETLANKPVSDARGPVTLGLLAR
ncbi:MAG: tyrosine-type recombinase/integrase [Deltaproteobacteria bacterium]|nr:tyrosine-type recombinase/integrase [Deltaproteobacteria bacterium]MBK7066854.1 tyrosine-type recombinase/integrase [Deltaproteobacteria bacterium]MBP6829227.1 tyrosine-type recombinase/integrase [Deltaproteobacteria bacterium]